MLGGCQLMQNHILQQPSSWSGLNLTLRFFLYTCHYIFARQCKRYFSYSVNLHLKLLASTHILVGHDLVAWQPSTRQSQVHFDKLSLMCCIGFTLRIENFTLNQEISIHTVQFVQVLLLLLIKVVIAMDIDNNSNTFTKLILN